MTMYRVELKHSNTGDEDWGSMYFHVFAKSEEEAWKKAEELEDSWNIKRLWAVKYIG